MRGMVFRGDRKVELLDFDDPTPGQGEAVIEIKASGMCGSDLKFYRPSRAEATIEKAEASSAALEELRATLADFRAQALDVQNQNQARIDTLKSQLDALGPAPAEGVKEADEVARRRTERVVASTLGSTALTLPACFFWVPSIHTRTGVPTFTSSSCSWGSVKSTKVPFSASSSAMGVPGLRYCPTFTSRMPSLPEKGARMILSAICAWLAAMSALADCFTVTAAMTAATSTRPSPSTPSSATSATSR